MTITLGWQLVAGLALALAFGGMTFFSAVAAPLVFTKLAPADAGRFIREVFPWYYLYGGVLSVVAAVSLALAGQTAAALAAAIAGAGFAFARQVLMPQINQARDGGRQARFNRLHRLSVSINLAQWLLIGAALILVILQ